MWAQLFIAKSISVKSSRGVDNYLTEIGYQKNDTYLVGLNSDMLFDWNDLFGSLFPPFLIFPK